MEHTESPADPVDAIRKRVKELRGKRGWNAEELGQRLEAAGIPWNRSIVANFESGRRRPLTVVEWLALARVLDVAPLNLLVPLVDGNYLVTPEESAPNSDVRAWVRGQRPLNGTDEHAFFTEVSLDDLRQRIEDVQTALELDGPKPGESLEDKQLREARRMTKQNRAIKASEEQQAGEDGGVDG